MWDIMLSPKVDDLLRRVQRLELLVAMTTHNPADGAKKSTQLLLNEIGEEIKAVSEKLAAEKDKP